MPEPLIVTLEFARARAAEDPYAFADGLQGYLLREAGGVYDGFEILWNESLSDDLDWLANPEPPAEVVGRMGERLREILLLAGWERHDQEIGQALGAGRRVIVDVLSAAAELYSLPWELVPLRSTGRPLAALPEVLIRYAWPATQTVASPAPDEGGRILFAWSEAAGAVPWEAQEEVLRAQVAAAGALVPLALDVLPQATPEGLIAALAARPTVLHLLCHGRFGGGLVLSSASSRIAGDVEVIDPTSLGQMLSPIASSLRLVVLCACSSGAMASVASPLGSLAQAVHRLGVPSVVAFRIPVTPDGATIATTALYRSLLLDLSSLEAAVLSAQEALLRRSGLDWAALQLLMRAEDGDDTRPITFRPYRGLLAFAPQHSRFFFGRDGEREELIGELELLQAQGQPRFQVVEGASGSGKSSLVLASVVPALVERGWAWARMVPGGDPMAAVDAALRTRPPGSAPFLLVVDQLEELFTQGTADAEGRAQTERFVRRLWALASGNPPIHVICTLRTDFKGRCGEVHLDDPTRLDQVFRPNMAMHHLFVASMRPDQLREVIARPAALVGLDLPSDLVDRALIDVGAEPGALPLLEYTLDLLWQRREGRRLNGTTYSALGGVSGALSGQAEAVFATFDPTKQKIARRLLVRLVNVQRDHAIDTRRRVPIAELRPQDAATAAAFDAVLAALVDARLLVRAGAQEATVEVAHETLIRTWGRIRTWVDEDREMLAELDKVEAWAAQRRDYAEALLSGKQLGYAQEVRERHADELSADALKLIGDSEVQAAQMLAHSRRRLRLGVAVALAGAAIFAVLGLVAWRQKEAADIQRGVAETQRAEAVAQRAEAVAQREEAQRAAQMAGARELLALGETVPEAMVLAAVQDPEKARGWSQLAVDVLAGRLPVAVLYHPASVVSATWSPDGKSIVTVCDDGAARVWKANGTGDPVVLKGPEGAILTAAWSPDSTRVVTASTDHSARIWKADGSGEPVVLQGHTDIVTSATWSPDGTDIATTSFDQTARIWSADGSGEPVVLRGHTLFVVAAAWSPDGRSIATASSDHSARVWNADGMGDPIVLQGHADVVWDVAWSPDGRRLLTRSTDGTARIRNADGTGDTVVLRAGQGSFLDAVWRPNGAGVVTASTDHAVSVWNADGSGQPIVLQGHSASVVSAAWRPDGTGIVSASEDGTARIWNRIGSDVILRGQEGSPRDAQWSPDGKFIVTAAGNAARVWIVDQPGLPLLMRGDGTRARAAAWSPDGKHIVTAHESKVARIWSADGTGDPIVLAGHEGAVVDAAWSPEGSHVATASSDGSARIWRADGTVAPVVLTGHEGRVVDVAWSPDGARIATASDDRTARVWRADGGGDPVVLRGHEDKVWNALWSPDGRRILTLSKDNTARIWSADGSGVPVVLKVGEAWLVGAGWSPDSKRVFLAAGNAAWVCNADGTGSPIVLNTREFPIGSAEWSPDGTHILATHYGTVRIWNADGTGEPLSRIVHERMILSAAWSPDGKRVVTASDDNTARIWNADGTGEPLVLPRPGIRSAAWSPDGEHILTLTEDDGAQIWPITIPVLQQALRGATTDCLDVEQRRRYLAETEADARTGYEACERSHQRTPHAETGDL